ncbi:aspartate-semialdehyde dehydrogenase [Buchnera aphidicola]|uniref:Aspartate-semialdehyde dehydrogenase n=1 Tax=Buchnera aphidicola (Anoecia oenotherae) TaxID=1241833 RepID=A0A4D6XR29_9GAMM|nr:aspartate-semialdehyde dehydrogenase [Buchnera aphidicola]QCI19463.1 aspartate-semialdehyde dehydrogenase [Buchnera aphidicola (Anoecia oenotherae)]
MNKNRKKTVGFVGWRGMVGSVLLQRMIEKKDFKKINAIFFTTSQIGEKSPIIKDCNHTKLLQNAYDIDLLYSLDIIITCYGTEYTNLMYYKLRSIGWKGYWIDAASELRMIQESCIVLDPINLKEINKSIDSGIKTFVGANCTVSLMLMSLGGLFSANLIEWISVSTYQAASGAGAKHMLELLNQMNFISKNIDSDLENESMSILNIEKKITNLYKSKNFPKKYFKIPLLGNLIPWIDSIHNIGQTREEWKIQAETNKIISSNKKILIDGNCVRIATLRCHSQSFVIKLKQDISIIEVETILRNHNKWVSIIPNTAESSLKYLNPAYVSGTLFTPIGRIRKLNIGKKYLSAFTVGDQLLWGAAEPLRRILCILVK